MKRRLLALLLSLPLACAAEAPPPPPVPLTEEDGPPVPSGTSEASELEPEVTIIQREEETVTEYRLNGELYMVKIVPKVGFPYYLIDRDGDGQLESRYNRLEPNIVVPTWMIYRW